jgi:hypothetical protein
MVQFFIDYQRKSVPVKYLIKSTYPASMMADHFSLSAFLMIEQELWMKIYSFFILE